MALDLIRSLRLFFCAAFLPLLACAASAQKAPLMPIEFQFGGQDQGGGQYGNNNSIVGNWHQVQQTQDGGTMHTYWMFGEDGSFRESAVQVGGAPGANGSRTQVWGHYEARPAQNGSLYIVTTLTGRAPLQICMPGMGCRATPQMAGTLKGYFQVQGNMFQTTGITAQRDNVPPAMLQQLPATWTLQPPPPLPSSSSSSGSGGSGGYNPPKYHVPGQGGTCDDLQVSRVCTVNGGSTYRNRETGCLVCTR